MRGAISDGQGKNQELRVEIDPLTRRLVISIGVDVLAFAAERSEPFQPYDEKRGDWVQAFVIHDTDGFARDVVCALQDEGEDGSTHLTRLLDKMTLAALEDGSDSTEECPPGTPILGEVKA